RALAEEDPVAVLPLAAVEQHGPHLPLSTDQVIGEGILEAALEELSREERPIVVLPPQVTGASLEHEGYPGTLSLGAGTLRRMVTDTGRSLGQAGIRRLVISNSHGGNRAAVDLAALELRRELSMLVVKAHYFRFPRPDSVALPEAEWRHGLHGGAVETAMMLHLRPELVRSHQIRRFSSLGEELEDHLVRVAPEGQAAFAWSAEDLDDRGVAGDATLADARMGQDLVRHYGSCLADVVRDAARFPMERLGGETA
ncbi:MAG: creatininase family protein, partial [Longimicrobiales bacterium]|nr:creatininase family protein [Longimicrobiales bacterium]